MIAGLAAHLWQSTLCAAAAGLLTFALRRNDAAIRHAVWCAASVKFLLPFAALTALWEILGFRAPVEAPGLLVLSVQAAVAPVSTPTHFITVTLGTVWICGILFVAGRRFRDLRALHAALREARPLALPAPIPVLGAPWAQEPGLVGLLRPRLVLPEGIDRRLSPAELRAVLDHELCHWRRRDNLIAALHMVTETLFWFHPLVWWIGTRLVEERERACDEYVLTAGNDAGIYAESILKVCKLYLTPKLSCTPGMSGADLKTRIEAIMANRCAQPLGRGGRALLATAGAAVVLIPVAAVWLGFTDAPQAPPARCDQSARLCSPRHDPARPNIGAREIYPAESLQQREEGVVVLMLTVDDTGRVTRALVKTPSGHARLDDAARAEALASWRFLPGTVDGAPRAMRMPIRVTFRMKPA